MREQLNNILFVIIESVLVLLVIQRNIWLLIVTVRSFLSMFLDQSPLNFALRTHGHALLMSALNIDDTRGVLLRDQTRVILIKIMHLCAAGKMNQYCQGY